MPIAVLYRHEWPLCLYHIYPHHLISDTFSREKVTEHKNVFYVHGQILSQIFLSLRRIQRDICINVGTEIAMYSTRYSYQILIKPEFSTHILENSLCAKFHQTPSSGSRVVPCGQTDGLIRQG